MVSTDGIWQVDFGSPYPSEPAGHRPALVLGPPGRFGNDFPFVLVAPMTTTDRGLSLHVAVEPDAESGLDERSFIQCEQIRSVSRARLVHRRGQVTNQAASSVRSVLRTLLDL